MAAAKEFAEPSFTLELLKGSFWSPGDLEPVEISTAHTIHSLQNNGVYQTQKAPRRNCRILGLPITWVLKFNDVYLNAVTTLYFKRLHLAPYKQVTNK